MQPADVMARDNLNLFQLCLADPYLKDCRNTILASEEACQTLGYNQGLPQSHFGSVACLGAVARIGWGGRCFVHGSKNNTESRRIVYA